MFRPWQGACWNVFRHHSRGVHFVIFKYSSSVRSFVSVPRHITHYPICPLTICSSYFNHTINIHLTLATIEVELLSWFCFWMTRLPNAKSSEFNYVLCYRMFHFMHGPWDCSSGGTFIWVGYRGPACDHPQENHGAQLYHSIRHLSQVSIIPEYFTNINQKYCRPIKWIVLQLLTDFSPIKAERRTCTCACQSNSWIFTWKYPHPPYLKMPRDDRPTKSQINKSSPSIPSPPQEKSIL